MLKSQVLLNSLSKERYLCEFYKNIETLLSFSFRGFGFAWLRFLEQSRVPRSSQRTANRTIGWNKIKDEFQRDHWRIDGIAPGCLSQIHFEWFAATAKLRITKPVLLAAQVFLRPGDGLPAY